MHQQSTIKFVPGRNPGNRTTDSDDKLEFRTPAPLHRAQYYNDSGEITKTSLTTATLSTAAQDPEKQADYYAASPWKLSVPLYSTSIVIQGPFRFLRDYTSSWRVYVWICLIFTRVFIGDAAAFRYNNLLESLKYVTCTFVWNFVRRYKYIRGGLYKCFIRIWAHSIRVCGKGN